MDTDEKKLNTINIENSIQPILSKQNHKIRKIILAIVVLIAVVLIIIFFPKYKTKIEMDKTVEDNARLVEYVESLSKNRTDEPQDNTKVVDYVSGLSKGKNYNQITTTEDNARLIENISNISKQ